jgi:L-amino acid N-acyltransferase YncA
MVRTRAATADDLPAIAALMADNAPARGGSLTGDWSLSRIEAWFDRIGTVFVADDASVLVGCLFASEKTAMAGAPIALMLAAYPGTPSAYVYGPVCIGEAARGKGILPALYAEATRHFPDREAILFIRADNARSLSAHGKLGMTIVGAFEMAGATHMILSSAPRSAS